jgi:abhydrolase domain-containing protein 17
MEYPGYGVYPDIGKGEDRAQLILNDSEIVLNYISEKLRYLKTDIIVCGHSIGSGPACHLASKFPITILILISPYTSIRGILKDFFLGSVA